MKKKLLSLILALTLALSLAVPAFAAEDGWKELTVVDGPITVKFDAVKTQDAKVTTQYYDDESDALTKRDAVLVAIKSGSNVSVKFNESVTTYGETYGKLSLLNLLAMCLPEWEGIQDGDVSEAEAAELVGKECMDSILTFDVDNAEDKDLEFGGAGYFIASGPLGEYWMPRLPMLPAIDGTDGKLYLLYAESEAPAMTPDSDSDPTPAGLFADVKPGDWYAKAVQYAVDNGLMNGVGNGKFDPNGTTTRGQLMTILARMSGEDTTGSSPWYQKGMDWAKAQKISDGKSPEANISREQLATMLYRLAGEPETSATLSGFPDNGQVSGYAVKALSWAVEQGIVTGKGVNLAPKGNATRAETATMLMRYCEKMGK